MFVIPSQLSRKDSVIMIINRDTWWKNIGIPSKTDPRRKKFVSYFFTGSKEEFSNKDQVDLEELLESPAFQNEFCNFLIHTSIYG